MLTLVLAAASFTKPVVAKDKEEVEIPKPENIALETKDGVQLRCTWYAGTLGKKTVPIIMLHDWEGVRGEYADIARKLQERGHAVIVPDLRGHGDSKTMMARGVAKTIDLKRLGKAALVGMVEDIKTVKSFLREKNNAGELNIEMLTVVASGKTAIVAMTWAVADWNLPQFVNDVKQGKDVKALVLLSPERSFKGVTTSFAEKNGLFNGIRSPFTFSVMVLVGERSRKHELTAETLYENITRTRPELDENLTKDQVLKQKNHFFIRRDVSLQGTDLLDPDMRLELEKPIYGFVHYRLELKGDEYPWTNRTRGD